MKRSLLLVLALEPWLHLYRASGSAYIDAPARSVPHPASLTRGDDTWRVCEFPRDGAYRAFVGPAQNDTSGRVASLGLLAFGESKLTALDRGR